MGLQGTEQERVAAIVEPVHPVCNCSQVLPRNMTRTERESLWLGT